MATIKRYEVWYCPKSGHSWQLAPKGVYESWQAALEHGKRIATEDCPVNVEVFNDGTNTFIGTLWDSTNPWKGMQNAGN